MKKTKESIFADSVFVPKYLFVKSDYDDRNLLRLFPLEGQYVILDCEIEQQLNKLIKVDSTWMVSANKRKRHEYPLNTVFMVKKAIAYTDGKRSFIIAKDREYLEPVKIEDAVEKIKFYNDNLISDNPIRISE